MVVAIGAYVLAPYVAIQQQLERFRCPKISGIFETETQSFSAFIVRIKF